MNSDPSRYVEITRPDDARFLPWLDLYETAFPPAERLLVSDLLRVLQARAAGRPGRDHLLAAVDAAGELLGMAYVTIVPAEVAYLMYLAVKPAARNQGLGAAFYREIVARAAAAGCAGLILEVEMPERAADAEQRALAERRIAFYRRLGARLLRGIHYLQSVGWHQPPTPMHIMAHPLAPLDPAAAFRLAQALFDGAVSQVGELALV